MLDDDAQRYTVRIWWTDHTLDPQVFHDCTEVEMEDNYRVDFRDSSGKQHNCSVAAYEVISE